MSVLEIKKAGDPILRQIAEPVAKIDRKIKKILDEMTETMYQAEGIGLAAPQVGISLRIVVIDVGQELIELINPVIIEADGSATEPEGCLSVPGMYGEVERCTSVIVEGLNRTGKKVRISASGLLARALQHEIDHLNGVLFIDRAKTIYKGQS